MPKKKMAPTPRQKLVEAEHMVEADNDQAAFEKRLNKIAKAKAKPPKRKPKRS